MAPRNRVTTSYRKAERRPAERSVPITIPMATPRGLSPLAKYLHENEESGLTVKELIEQFQEYDCTHDWDVLAATVLYVIRRCKHCGLNERKFKPGEKPND